MEEWELRYCQDWRGLERELNRKVYIGELVIHEIKKEGVLPSIQPKYHLSAGEKSIPVFEFHLKEPLYKDWVSKLEEALRLVGDYAKIGIERIYITPTKICGDYPVAGVDKRERLAYFPLSYLFSPQLSLHVWHENIHALLPEQKARIDESEEFAAKRLSKIFGRTILDGGWDPEYDLSSGWTSELKWDEKTVAGMLKMLEGCIREDILETALKDIVK